MNKLQNIYKKFTLHSEPAEVDEVAQMRFPPVLVFSSIHPFSKIIVATISNQLFMPTVCRTSGTLKSGRIPDTLKLTTFRTLLKKLCAIQTTDLRRIASSRLFYKVFGYLIPGRVEEILEAKQPEEQHGFRPGRRLEEHLLTANLLLDKAAAAGITVLGCKFQLVKGI